MEQQPPIEAENAQPPETTYLQRLNQGEQHWAWKSALRGLMCALDIAAIGMAIWIAIVSNVPGSYYFNLYQGAWAAPAYIVVSGISLIWCAVWLLVLFLRRPPRAAAPGIAAGMDLVLWLGFAITAVFAAFAYTDLIYFGDGGVIQNPNYNEDYLSQYQQAANGTWILVVTYVNPDTYGPYSDVPYTEETVPLSCTEFFPSCEAQTAFVNHSYRLKHTYEAVVLAILAIQSLGIIFHMVLFIWACVDTHRRRRSEKQSQAMQIADRIIRDMQARGLITIHQNPVAQGYIPMTQQQKQPYQPPQVQVEAPPAEGVATAGNEKLQDPDAIQPVRYG